MYNAAFYNETTHKLRAFNTKFFVVLVLTHIYGYILVLREKPFAILLKTTAPPLPSPGVNNTSANEAGMGGTMFLKTHPPTWSNIINTCAYSIKYMYFLADGRIS
jgi:hypothetical protein